MIGPACKYGVTGLKGHDVLLTGKAYINDSWTYRKDLVEPLRSRGATIAFRERRSASLFVFGDLSGKVTLDPANGLSQKALYVIGQRLAGNHAHVVDSSGLSSLMDGGTAMCLDLYTDRPVIGVRRSDYDAKPALIGTRLDVVWGLERTAISVIRSGLVNAMTSGGTTVFRPGPRMPTFDAAWRSKDKTVMYVARIVVLDVPEPVGAVFRGLARCSNDRAAIVAHGIAKERQIRPVLIIDREPKPEWMNKADKLDVHLTWPRRFPPPNG